MNNSEIRTFSDEERNLLVSLFKINRELYTDTGLDVILSRRLKGRSIDEVVKESYMKLYKVPAEFLSLDRETAFELYRRAGKGRIGKNIDEDTPLPQLIRKLYNRLNRLGLSLEDAYNLPEVSNERKTRSRKNKMKNPIEFSKIESLEDGKFKNFCFLLKNHYPDLQVGFYPGKTLNSIVFLSLEGNFRIIYPVSKSLAQILVS